MVIDVWKAYFAAAMFGLASASAGLGGDWLMALSMAMAALLWVMTIARHELDDKEGDW